MSARWYRWSLLVLLSGAALSMLGCRTVHQQDLFFPRRVERPPAEEGRDDIVLQAAGGLEIGGWNIRTPSPRAQLIYFYGNGETVADSLRRMTWLADLGHLDVMCVDYRGYGFSEGVPSIEGMLEDALTVYDRAAASRSDDTLPILVFGRSLGTAAAQHIASHRPVDGMILEAPFTSINDVLRAWNRALPIPVRWIIRLRPESCLANLSPQPIEAIPAYTQPLLVIHGAQDTVIPMTLGQRVYEAAGSADKTWCSVEGKGHNNLSLNTPEVETALRDFLLSPTLTKPQESIGTGQ